MNRCASNERKRLTHDIIRFETVRDTNPFGIPWYGRGDVQLTWEDNYAKADAALAKAGLIKAG